MVWFNSEGAKPQIVIQKLQEIGFKPIRGPYDHVYEWKDDVELDEVIKLGDTVHDALKGFNVLYKLETTD